MKRDDRMANGCKHALDLVLSALMDGDAHDTLPTADPKRRDRLAQRVARVEQTGLGGGCGAVVEHDTTGELGELLADPNTPERQLEARELAAAIEGFLSTLSRDDRVIFMRRYWLASPLGEIARDFGCSTARVKSSLHRSRKKLKQHLEEEGLL